MIAVLLMPWGNAYAEKAGLSQAEIRQIFPDMAPVFVPESRYADLVARVAQSLGLEAGLIDAVIARESNYQAGVVSATGAVGLMQLMPDGGARDAYEYLRGHPGQPTTAGLKRADVNVWLGSAYLRLLRDRYYSAYAARAGMPLMLAAYNWGIGHMLDRPPSSKRVRTRAQALAWIDKTCPKETRVYVRRVLSWYDKHKPMRFLDNDRIAVAAN